MVRDSTDKMFKEAGEMLQMAVYEEMLRKSKLGQYAIIEQNGKTCRILASEIIKNMHNQEKEGHA